MPGPNSLLTTQPIPADMSSSIMSDLESACAALAGRSARQNVQQSCRANYNLQTYTCIYIYNMYLHLRQNKPWHGVCVLCFRIGQWDPPCHLFSLPSYAVGSSVVVLTVGQLGKTWKILGDSLISIKLNTKNMFFYINNDFLWFIVLVSPRCSCPPTWWR